MTKQLACDAMQMAIDQRTDFAGVIMHTDRGSQYCSKQFQSILTTNDILSSMSKKGDCYDNACSESFFHTLKVEAIHGELFPTLSEPTICIMSAATIATPKRPQAYFS